MKGTGNYLMSYLVLADGSVFEGKSFGADADVVGELVFTTSVVGYPECLTDPSYAGQIVLQTFPMIGNYGVCEEDFEGVCAVKGVVVREFCETPSNFRSQGTIDAFMKKHGIPGICGVDTRQLTRILRDKGVMNAMICKTLPEAMDAVRNYSIKDTVQTVSCKAPYVIPAEGETVYRMTVLDCGVKKSTVLPFAARGCEITVVPCDTDAETILAGAPDGVMLSDGPGDPAEFAAGIGCAKALLGKVPMLGVGLGHQLIALASGAKTVKMPFGHRGSNQPVRDLITGRTYITTQNHGYAVLPDGMGNGARVRYCNANDNTCEGIDYPGHACFTVQFHPALGTGTAEAGSLFERFISMMAMKKGGN